MNYIIIDTGTTNTRIRLVNEKEVLASYKDKIGVKDTAIKGSLDSLKASIKDGIIQCLQISKKQLDDIDSIIAYGMITSNLGLLEINHLISPIDIEGLSKGIEIKEFGDIVNKPIYFIPGIKNKVDKDSLDLDEIDMMRGEEVETIGILELDRELKDIIYISPGSHTKFVFVNNRQIVKCSTTLTGEILSALSKETILADSLPQELITSIDREYIEKGLNAAKDKGFTKSCFLVRIMDQFTQANANQLANFIGGVAVYYDIISIEKYLEKDNSKIVIGGNSILKDLYNSSLMLMGYKEENIKILEEDAIEKSSIYGAIETVKKHKAR